MVEIGTNFSERALLYREKEKLYRAEKRLYRGQNSIRSSDILSHVCPGKTMFFIIFVVRSFALFCSLLKSESGLENQKFAKSKVDFLKRFVIFTLKRRFW